MYLSSETTPWACHLTRRNLYISPTRPQTDQGQGCCPVCTHQKKLFSCIIVKATAILVPVIFFLAIVRETTSQPDLSELSTEETDIDALL